jgi:hypothetical protein
MAKKFGHAHVTSRSFAGWQHFRPNVLSLRAQIQRHERMTTAVATEVGEMMDKRLKCLIAVHVLDTDRLVRAKEAAEVRRSYLHVVVLAPSDAGASGISSVF